jgi:nitroreductase
MDIFELVKARRSVRAYESRAVEEGKLEQILETANRAPSAGNLQAYVILVVRSAATKQALVRAALGQDFIAQAPVVLAFFAHRLMSASKYKQRGAELYSVQDATVACAYAQLAAAALGLGSVWVGAFDDTEVARILRAKPEWRPVALLPVGYPAESPEPTQRRAVEELAKEANHG